MLFAPARATCFNGTRRLGRLALNDVIGDTRLAA
jgi:hypothetical protein